MTAVVSRWAGRDGSYRSKAVANWTVWFVGRSSAAITVAVSAHLMTRKEFGLQIAAAAIGGVTTYVVLGSLSDLIARHVAQGGRERQISTRLLVAEARKCLLRFVGIGLVAVLAALASNRLPLACVIEGLLLGATQAALNAISGVFRGAGRIVTFALGSTTGTGVGRLALVVALVGAFHVRNASAVLLAWLCWDGVQIAAFARPLRRHLDHDVRDAHLQRSALFYWTGLLWPVLTNLDLLAASWIIGPAAGASYGGPMRMGEATTQVQFAYSAPFIAAVSAEEGDPRLARARSVYHRVTRDVCLVTIPLIAFVFINAGWCVHLLLGSTAKPNPSVLQVLLVGYAVQSCTGVNYQALLVLGDVWFLGLTSICGAAGTIVAIGAMALTSHVVLIAVAMSAGYVGVNAAWSARLWSRWRVATFDSSTRAAVAMLSGAAFVIFAAGRYGLLTSPWENGLALLLVTAVTIHKSRMRHVSREEHPAGSRAFEVSSE